MIHCEKTTDMTMIALVNPAPCLLGEGALWQAGAGSLWWVDIRGKRLFRHWSAAERNSSWLLPDWITRVIPNDDTGSVARATLGGALGLLDVSGDEPLFTPSYEMKQAGMRFNDGQVDPDGRWWAGTMRIAEDRPVGQWLRFDAQDRAPEIMAEGFTVTNGPCFDRAAGQIYLTDSAAQVIFRGTYDATDGLRDLKAWRTFGDADGYPDGMTMGPDGLLWVAFWDGGCIRGLDGTGAVVREITLPVRRPTSIAFASPTEAYVTSAALGLDADDWQGCTLALSLTR